MQLNMLVVKQTVMRKIEIAPEHIKEAEMYLLGNGRYFETKERIPFIKKLETKVGIIKTIVMVVSVLITTF